MITNMNDLHVRRLAEQLLGGELSLDQFVGQLTSPLSQQLGPVTLDLDRQQRCGFPEVIFGEGKDIATLQSIVRTLVSRDIPVLATRVAPEKAEALTKRFANGRYNSRARTFRIDRAVPVQSSGRVAVVTAGTSDLPVAEEARETVEWMGAQPLVVHDIGVAGPHRLYERLDEIRATDVVIVAAGMEGALPSVVGGHVQLPVIAVPTSTGYGASFGGVAALLGMLNSCAANVTVVNIDAGFKAGYLAGLIASRTSTGSTSITSTSASSTSAGESVVEQPE
jgi:pyridinium-3,5-biscarboxylic acid mononucleotide synthase